MEQRKRSAIIILARAGHSPSEIVKLTKLLKATVYRVYKYFKEEGKVDRKAHKLRSDSKRSPRFLAGLRRSIKANPSVSMTTHAKKGNVSLSTVSRAVNKNLGMTSYTRGRRHLITNKIKIMRAERCRKLLSFIKRHGPGKTFVFVDEKNFVVDAEVNRRNSRVIGYSPSDVTPVLQTKHPASVMVFGAAASDGGVMDPHFIEAGVKIGTKEYVDILRNVLILWLEQKFDLNNVILIQDSAPCHAAKATQAFLAEKVPHFVPTKIWPSNSPDLNLLDYFFVGHPTIKNQ